MIDTFDVIVIGGGPAGENAVGRCAAGGLTVALVERELVGGECSYWGCVPSKTLRPEDVLAAARRVPGASQAVNGGDRHGGAFAQRDYQTSNLSDRGQGQWLEAAGATLVRGHGRLAGERAVEVTQNGTTTLLRARRAVVLATGAGPLCLRSRGWPRRWRGRIARRPRHRAFPSACSSSAAAPSESNSHRHTGDSAANVAIVEGAPRLLGREEPFAGEEVRAAFEAEGIDVLVSARAASVSGRTARSPSGSTTAVSSSARNSSSASGAVRTRTSSGWRPLG